MRMDWLPHTIRHVSLPSAVFFTLFLWNGIVYLGFSRTLPLKDLQKLRFTLFGLTSLSLSVYSFATFELYSAVEFRMSFFCDQLQMASLVPVFILFVLFTTSYLDLPRRYFSRIVPVATLAFLPFLFWEGMFFRPEPMTRYFDIFGYTTHITEARPGPVFFLFLAWAFPHIAFLAWKWLRAYREHFRGWELPFGVSVFFFGAVNDALVGSDAYRFFYVIELSFAVLIGTMSFLLFKFYVIMVRELDRKSREVAVLNEEMQFLVSSMSHDLKAPLITIRGFSGLMREGEAEMPEKRGDFLRRIENNSAQMLEWLEDLIIYMRVGWVLEDRTPVDLGKVAEEVEGMLTTPCRERLVEIRWPDSWPSLCSSPKGLKQILLNLLQNAIKFSPEGTGVQVECFREKNAVQLWVSDRGPGIPKELQEKVFRPFFRNPSPVQGSGMGLAIVKKVAEKLGGRAWLDPAYQPGARLCVYLPDSKGKAEL